MQKGQYAQMYCFWEYKLLKLEIIYSCNRRVIPHMSRCNLSTEGSPYDLHSRHTGSVGVAAKPCPIFSPDPKPGDLSNIVIKGQNQEDMVYIYYRYSLCKSTSNPSSRYKDFVLINLRLIFQIPVIFV